MIRTQIHSGYLNSKYSNYVKVNFLDLSLIQRHAIQIPTVFNKDKKKMSNNNFKSEEKGR